MKKLVAILLATGLMASLLGSKRASAQSTEDQFRDIFITAGYATAFGAALGAAALGLQSNPEENLNYIAVGASLGFIGGSIMGAYMVMTPVMADRPSESRSLLSQELRPRTIYVRPHIAKNGKKLTAIEGAFNLLTF